MLNVKDISKSHYIEAVNNSVSVSVFSTLEWLELVCPSNTKLFLKGIYSDEELLAVYPIFFIHGKLLRRINLPYLTPHVGITLLGKKNDYQLQRLIHSTFFKELKTYKADDIHYAFPPEFTDAVAIKYSGLTIVPQQTYQIDLLPDQAQLMSQLKTDKRRNIKNGLKEGLSVSFEKDAKIMDTLVSKTYLRQGKEAQWKHLIQPLINQFPNSIQVTVSNDHQPLSSIYIVYDSTTAYYLFGGFDNDANNYNAGPLAMWNGILAAKELDLKIFDFEGSEIPEIERYFQRFGSSQKIYLSVNKTSSKQQLINRFR